MPRPRLSDADRRIHRVAIWLSPNELRELRSRASIARLSVPEYVRQRSVRWRLNIESPRRLAADHFREVQRIGNNLNQIARNMNMGRAAPEGTREELTRLRDLLSLLLPEAAD
ncbi:MAG: MobC family plasmid mobilization relaxosome protein [Gemmatimonadetes bacterium]|nr:MobC family plasmid mobilization relaxosome protein [Gemmatimonadota bacterium]MYJ12116.1 MobC family plasmid mobilization relaxosome protein [Gemmatimonadota bacterium]